jgi:GNAT superfamily N-acetyltransferase
MTVREIVAVRHMTHEDIGQVVALQERVYPGMALSGERFAQQIEVFPQGQLVARIGPRVVGMASSLIVRWDDWGLRHTWREVTGHGSFETHFPQGRTLYGAEVLSDPELRRYGIGKKLYQGRRRVCRALNLRRIMACGRMPGYHKHAASLTPEEYAMRVIWGDLVDPVMLFQMNEGFRYCGVVHDYLASDTESCGHAAVIVWLNDRYRADQPTRQPEGPIL